VAGDIILHLISKENNYFKIPDLPTLEFWKPFFDGSCMSNGFSLETPPF
jgi:hypothetical protein